MALKGICLKLFCMVTEYLLHWDLRNHLDNPTDEVKEIEKGEESNQVTYGIYLFYIQLMWHVRLKIDVTKRIHFLHSTTPFIISSR